MTELSDPIQLMFSQLIVVLLIPFFYQTFLQIAAFMCSPVNHDEFALPIASFIKRIEKDLVVQAELAENPPGWTAPSFRVKPNPVATKERDTVSSLKMGIPGMPGTTGRESTSNGVSLSGSPAGVVPSTTPAAGVLK